VVYNAVGIQKTSLRHFSMEHSKGFWRGLFFIILVTALCGGLALPIVSVPARAAPQMANALDVVINEVAWAGTAASSSDEWIELYNPGSSPIDLTGWQLYGDNNVLNNVGDPNITLAGTIPAGGYFLLEKNESAISDISADQVYTNGNLVNSGERLYLKDNLGNIIDTANVGGGSWPAGTAGTGSPTYGSMERVNNLAPDSDSNWATNDGLVRNGSNSAPGPINGTPKQPNSATLAVTATASAANLTGTASVLTNTAAAANLTATASAANLTNTAAAANTPTNTSIATATNTSPASTSGIVISEFRTRGPGGASDEFIELYNPTSTAVDISGWKINGSNNAGAEETRATIPASTLLRSGQYYLVANNGYTGSVIANLKYGTAITNDGGIALLRSNNTIADEVGMDAGSAYQEGTTLPRFSGTTSDQSYERKLGGASDSCIDTNDNASDFGTAGSGSLHNYASPLSLCGAARPVPSTTTTTITADSPDPSLINANIIVSVKVTGGSSTPSGLVNITGANTNCTITLNSSGTGSCTVKFTTTGTKALIATYLGDNTHASSTDGESHLVATTSTIRTPTRAPTPLPPPPLIGINEFVPRPGHDWNNDGVINVGDEYIELLNHGVIDVNLSGYSLDDEVNIGSNPYRLPAITLKPGERHVFYGSETGLLLSDGGDGVRLLKPNGQLGDAYNYFVVRFPDQSYCRLPDNGGLDDWNQNCFPTPGLQNSLSGSSVNPPTENGAENLCPISDTLPPDFVLAECPPFGNNIWNPAYWDKFGWYDEKDLPESPGKWPVFAE